MASSADKLATLARDRAAPAARKIFGIAGQRRSFPQDFHWPSIARATSVDAMYSSYNLSRAMAEPLNSWAGLLQTLWSHPAMPLSGTPLARVLASASELLERA